MVAQSKSKSALMASCVLEEFDYQRGVNLSFSPPDATRFHADNMKDITRSGALV